MEKLYYKSFTYPHISQDSLDRALRGEVQIFWHDWCIFKKLSPINQVKLSRAINYDGFVVNTSAKDIPLYNYWNMICENKGMPTISVRQNEAPNSFTRSQKWMVHVDFVTSSWRMDRVEGRCLLESCIVREFPLVYKGGESAEGHCTVSVSSDVWQAVWLAEQEAHATARRVWGRLNDFVAMKSESNTKSVGKNKKENNMVKFFKDGKALAIQTDATDEREFTQDFAIAFEDYITGEKFEGQHEIIRWLNGYAEVCCKMRGYKADVKEQRLITFGDVNPQSEALVTSVANGTQVLQNAAVS